MATDLVLFNDFFTIPNHFFRLLGLVEYNEIESRPKTVLRLFWFNIVFGLSFINLFLCFMGECVFFVLGVGDFDNFLKLTALAPCMALTGMALQELAMMWWQRKKLTQLIGFLQRIYPNGRQEQVKYRIPKAKKELRLLMINFASSYMTLINAFNFIPVIMAVVDFFENGVWKMELPYFIWYPFDSDSAFTIIYLQQIWGGFTTVIAILAINLFLGATVTQFCIQFDVLNTKLKLLHPHKDNYLKDMKRISEIIKNHCDLIENFSVLEHLFSVSILVNYIMSSLIICLVGFQVVAGEDSFVIIKFLLFLICSLLQTMTMSYFGNQIIERVSDLS